MTDKKDPKTPPPVIRGEDPVKAAREELAASALALVKDGAAHVAAEIKKTPAKARETWDAARGKVDLDPGLDPLAAVVTLENMMGPHKPTITNDITMSGGPASMSVHQGLAPYPTYEQHFPACNPIDAWMGKRKLSASAAKKTLHRKRPIVLQGHDLRLIPHAVFAPLPPEQLALLAKCTFLSSRKCVFGAAKIMIDKTAPLGSCTLFNWPPTPMVFCADPISLPLGCAPTSHFNHVRFHMSMLDYVMGWIDIGVDMVVSAILAHDKTGMHDEGVEWGSVFLESLNPAGAIGENLAQSVGTSAVQTAVLAAYDTTGDDHEPQQRSVKWSVSAGVFGFETFSASIEVEKDQEGSWGAKNAKVGGLIPTASTWGDVL
jgi:hypothetical protein